MASLSDEAGFKVKGQNGLRKREVERCLRFLLEKKKKIEEELRKPMECVGLHSDPSDHSSVVSDRNFEDCERLRQSSILKRVNVSLERIRKGEYGICQGDTPKYRTGNSGCKGEIEYAVLANSPMDELCSHCIKEIKRRDQDKQKARTAAAQRPLS